MVSSNTTRNYSKDKERRRIDAAIWFAPDDFKITHRLKAAAFSREYMSQIKRIRGGRLLADFATSSAFL